MKLSVVTPEGSYYEGEVTSVTLPGFDGSFGVLPGHCPMISLVSAGELKAQSSDGQSTSILLSGGYVQVLGDKVTVLATFASPVSDITQNMVDEAFATAQGLKATGNEENFQLKDEAWQKAYALKRLLN